MVLYILTLLCNHHCHPHPEPFSSSRTETLPPSDNYIPFFLPSSPWLNFFFSIFVIVVKPTEHKVYHLNHFKVYSAVVLKKLTTIHLHTSFHLDNLKPYGL